MKISKITKPAHASVLQDLLFAAEEMRLEFDDGTTIIHLGPADHRENALRAEESTVLRHILQSVLAEEEPELVVHNERLENILEALLEANL